MHYLVPLRTTTKGTTALVYVFRIRDSVYRKGETPLNTHTRTENMHANTQTQHVKFSKNMTCIGEWVRVVIVTICLTFWGSDGCRGL